MIIIALSIKTIRLNHNLTQQEFANRINKHGVNCDHRNIQSYERNRAKPPLEVIEAICIEFEIANLEKFLFAKN